MDAYKTINAHVETVGTAPSYRRGFKKRPIQMKDDSPFVFAGLWEGWRDPAKDEWVHTCTTITGEANDLVREIQTGMPVILPEEHHQAWLSGEAGKEILIPYTGEKMKASAISPRVNSPRNNDPTTIAPAAWPLR